MSAAVPPEDELLTPAEFAALFRVGPKSVVRWANAGKISVTRTPGGHRRYYRAEADRLLREGTVPASARVLPKARKRGAA